MICIEKLLGQNPSLLPQLEPRIVQCLSDQDPGVAGAAVQVLTKVQSMKKVCNLHLVPSLLQFQEQILSGRLPTEYEYRSMAAPWLQINILHLIRILMDKSTGKAAAPPTTFDKIGKTLDRTMDLANLKETIGQAIIFECINTIASLNKQEASSSQAQRTSRAIAVSYTHLRAHETRHDLVCRLLLEKKK